MRESDSLRTEIDQLKEFRKETTQVNRHNNNSNNSHNRDVERRNYIAIEKFPVDLKRCDSPISDKQKRRVLEDSRSLDKKSDRRDKMRMVGTDGEFESEYENNNSDRNDDLDCSGEFFAEGQAEELRGNITYNDGTQNSSGVRLAKITEMESRISLAAAGTIEALTVLTGENSIQTRYETALSDKLRRSLLQYGRGIMDPVQWGKYRVFRGNYYVGRQAVSAALVEVDMLLCAVNYLLSVRSGIEFNNVIPLL